MAKRRRYTDDFRASAVLTLEAAGWPEQKGALTRVAKELKVSYRTLGRWATGQSNPPPDSIVQEKKDGLLELMNQVMVGILGDMDEARKDAPLNYLATAYGILFDKTQLLTGGPTESVKQLTAIAIVNTDEAKSL